jgi:hypothetical protein
MIAEHTLSLLWAQPRFTGAEESSS